MLKGKTIKANAVIGIKTTGIRIAGKRTQNAKTANNNALTASDMALIANIEYLLQDLRDIEDFE